MTRARGINSDARLGVSHKHHKPSQYEMPPRGNGVVWADYKPDEKELVRLTSNPHKQGVWRRPSR